MKFKQRKTKQNKAKETNKKKRTTNKTEEIKKKKSNLMALPTVRGVRLIDKSLIE